jgi:signal transduction histidine kinase
VLLIDTWLAMSALVAVAWVLVLAPLFDLLDTDPVTQVVAVATPLGQLGLVCCLLIALLREADTRKATAPLLIGLAVMAAGDAARGALMLNGTYSEGHPLDAFWFVALGIVSVAAIEERTHPEPSPRPAGLGRVHGPWRFVAPAALLLLTTVIVWLASLQRGVAGVGVAEVALATGWLLLLARVYVGFRRKTDEYQHERQLRVGHATLLRREQHRRKQVEAVHGLTTELARELDMAALLPLVAKQAAGLVQASIGVVLLWDAGTRVLAPRAWYGLGSSYGALRVEPGDGVVGQAIQRRRGVMVNDAPSAREMLLPLLTNAGVVAALATPLYSEGRLLGVVVVAEDRPGHTFSTGALQLLDVFSRQAALAIDHARLVDEAASLEALREVARLKTELLSTVSHELRTPLTLIHGYAELLNIRAASLNPDDVTMMAGEILVGSRTMIRLVDDLLDFSRMTSSRLHLDRVDMDMGAAILAHVQGWPDAAERERLQVEIAPGPLVAFADPKRVAQIVRHLLANALGHAPAGPVTVRVSAVTGWIVLEVADRGPGIPQAELPRIWESFFRGERARNSPHRGSGLGLAVVRQLVDLHGGRADVVSTEGQGTTFRIWRPDTRPATAATPA